MRNWATIIGAVAIAVGNPVSAEQPAGETSGRLDAGSPRDGRPYATRMVMLRAGQRYEFAGDSDDFDPILELYPADADISARDDGSLVIARDDDSGDGNNALIEFTPSKSGPYRLRIVSGNGTFGAYRFGVHELRPLPTPSRPAASRTSAMTVKYYTGSLTDDDPQSMRKALDDYLFYFEADKPALIFVDSNSSDFDPYASLYPTRETMVKGEEETAMETAVDAAKAAAPADGTVNYSGLPDSILSDDDGGEGTNALLAFTPTISGLYMLRVSSSGINGRGDYTIRIAQ